MATAMAMVMGFEVAMALATAVSPFKRARR